MRRTPWLVHARRARGVRRARRAVREEGRDRGARLDAVRRRAGVRAARARGAALCNEPSKGRKYLPEGSLVEIRKGHRGGRRSRARTRSSSAASSPSLEPAVTEGDPRHLRQGRARGPRPRRHLPGHAPPDSASNSRRVDRARKVEDATAGAGGATSCARGSRGGGSAEPAPPATLPARRSTTTNGDGPARRSPTAGFDASMRGVRVERRHRREPRARRRSDTFAGTTGRLGYRARSPRAATGRRSAHRLGRGMVSSAAVGKQPPTEAGWGGLLRARARGNARARARRAARHVRGAAAPIQTPRGRGRAPAAIPRRTDRHPARAGRRGHAERAPSPARRSTRCTSPPTRATMSTIGRHQAMRAARPRPPRKPTGGIEGRAQAARGARRAA